MLLRRSETKEAIWRQPPRLGEQRSCIYEAERWTARRTARHRSEVGLLRRFGPSSRAVFTDGRWWGRPAARLRCDYTSWLFCLFFFLSCSLQIRVSHPLSLPVAMDTNLNLSPAHLPGVNRITDRRLYVKIKQAGSSGYIRPRSSRRKWRSNSDEEEKFRWYWGRTFLGFYLLYFF